ncbi:MAG: hypothetical protein ABSG15_12055, partial [FCB group bacterium]
SEAQVKSRIIFKDGNKITGVIVPSKFNDSISLQVGGGFVVSYPKNNIKAIESLRKYFAFGIGIGIPYSILGINAAFEPVPYINATLGIGTPDFNSLAWEVGIVGYFLDQDNFIRPRISIFYGTNAIMSYGSYDYGSTTYESFPGFSVGVGIKTMLGASHGTTLDIFYILPNKSASDRQNELERQGYYFNDSQPIPINISVGYQFSF